MSISFIKIGFKSSLRYMSRFFPIGIFYVEGLAKNNKKTGKESKKSEKNQKYRVSVR